MSGEVLTAEYAGDSGIQPDGGIGRLATGAAVSPDATTLAVRTYYEVFFFHAVKDDDVVNWRGPGKPCFLGEAESQGEAIAYLDARHAGADLGAWARRRRTDSPITVLELSRKSAYLRRERARERATRTERAGAAARESVWGVRGAKPLLLHYDGTSRLTVCGVVILLHESSAGLGRRLATRRHTVTPGDLVVDPPTLINLGFEWVIDGDANRNASVAVSYRKAGETAWKNGMPLVRLQNERVTQPNVFNLVLPNMFAGSILDLEPDTAYEARFVMTDPDGVGGPAANATKTVTVRTRPEPKPAAGRQGLSRLSGRV